MTRTRRPHDSRIATPASSGPGGTGPDGATMPTRSPSPSRTGRTPAVRMRSAGDVIASSWPTPPAGVKVGTHPTERVVAVPTTFETSGRVARRNDEPRGGTHGEETTGRRGCRDGGARRVGGRDRQCRTSQQPGRADPPAPRTRPDGHDKPAADGLQHR